jgi:predicted ArsR family transcriptional regulator
LLAELCKSLRMERPGTNDADVLAKSTRARLLDLLHDLDRTATSDELAVRLGRHRSGVRVHLERLEAAGLVERRRVRQARGRPRDAWSLSPDARRTRGRPDAYAELAGWLADAIPARPARLREVEAAGRRLGHRLSDGGSDVPLQPRLADIFTALGFEPRALPTPAGSLCFELGNCPYRAAVRANQPVVCTLHRGLTQGLLDVLDSQGTLRSFVPKDPDRAGCLIEIEAGRAPAVTGEEQPS